MNTRMGEAPTETAEAQPSVPLQERVYARAFALTVRSGPTEAAIDELLELAVGNPHLLGRVRSRLAQLADENRGETHADRAVALATYAWLRAIAAA